MTNLYYKLCLCTVKLVIFAYDYFRDCGLPGWPLTLINMFVFLWFIYDSSLVPIVECLRKKWTFGAYFTTWPQMTFDLTRWPLTLSTRAAFHDLSMTKVWFQLDIPFWLETIVFQNFNQNVTYIHTYSSILLHQIHSTITIL